LVIVLAVVVVLLVWTASATCSLRTFEATASIRSQLTGPDAYRRCVAAMERLPGTRVLEQGEQEALVSVLPTPASMDRGWGLFVVVRNAADGVVLAGRRRIPLPGSNVGAALRQLERDARMRTG
jgi:hypothetical protein